MAGRAQSGRPGCSRRGLLALSLPLLAPGPGRAAAATPPGRLQLPPAPLREAWEAAGAPVVVVVPDHLGLDERADFYARPLLAGGVAVLGLDLPPAPGLDRAGGRLLLREPHRPGMAEAILPLLFAALRTLGQPLGGGSRRVGLLGFGPGGEAVLLAAHAAAAERGPAPRFAAHVALYPCCEGPRLPALLRDHAPTTGAPILVVLASMGEPGEAATGCGALFDNPARPDPFTVRTYFSIGYGFDLWPAVGEARTPRDSPVAERLDAARPDVATARLARQDVVPFLLRALAEGGQPAPR